MFSFSVLGLSKCIDSGCYCQQGAEGGRKEGKGGGRRKKKQLKGPEVAIEAEREGESGEERRENTGRRRPNTLENGEQVRWRKMQRRIAGGGTDS